MDKSVINDANVLQFMRQALAPVSIQELIKAFTTDTQKDAHDVGKAILAILIPKVKAGNVVQCNNHFYVSTLFDDLEALMNSQTDIDGARTSKSVTTQPKKEENKPEETASSTLSVRESSVVASTSSTVSQSSVEGEDSDDDESST